MTLRITIFGLSITSSWGNGHATTFRALFAALHRRGHQITFFEKDVEWYASNRDLPAPPYAKVIAYDDWESVLPRARHAIRECDVAIVGSYFPDGIAALQEIIDARPPVKAFYDIDTPVTVSLLGANASCEYLSREQLPQLDLYFSFTGGPLLRRLESGYGVKRALPLYCSFDPSLYHPRLRDTRLQCDLSYMGTYASDRQPKLDDLLLTPALQCMERTFIVAGSMYPDSVTWPPNVEHVQHLEPKYHSLLYSSSDFVLNITRREMVMAGHSPSVRLFEAAACGATIISDIWAGLSEFFAPEEEILLVSQGSDVVDLLKHGALPEIGKRARRRVLEQHTSDMRAREFEQAILNVGASIHAIA
jgi:spore maturation protein CgeB